MKKIITLSLILALLLTASAFAQSDMKAKIAVSGGGTYDYVIIGEMAAATDGFDNAYDAFSPAGSMNDLFIKTWVNHPEWNSVKSEFRTDFRSVKALQEWLVAVSSNLAPGTPLALEVDALGSNIPSEYTLTAQDMETNAVTDLRKSRYSFLATAATKTFKVIAAAATSQTATTDPALPAQTSFTVSGTVWDAAGLPVADVQISLTGGGTSFTAVSASNGAYAIRNVLAGTYRLAASKQRYRFVPRSITISNADVAVDIFSRVKHRRRHF